MRSLLTIIFLCYWAIASYASTEAKFSLVARTATTITVPTNRVVFIQYQVTNNTAVTRTLTMQPIPNVVQVTRDNTECSNPFVLAQGQSCNLTLAVDGSKLNSTSITGGPVVCKTVTGTNIPSKFLCSQPEQNMILSISSSPAADTALHKLYVTNWDGNSISLCYIDATTGDLIDCNVTAVSSTFANPEAIALSNSTPAVLFVANIGGGISSCIVDSITGDLSSCGNAIAIPNAPVYAPDGIAIVNNTAYISNAGPEQFYQGVTTCTVSRQFLTNCAFTQGDATFSVPSSLAITEDTVYVTNFNSNAVQTTYCAIGTPLCTTAVGEGTVIGTGALLKNPEGLTFATINANNYVYFTNHGDSKVVLCQVLSAMNFSSCAYTGGTFTGFGNLSILNNPLKAYIPSGLNAVDVCDVSAVDGSIDNCINVTQLSFSNPAGLLIH